VTVSLASGHRAAVIGAAGTIGRAVCEAFAAAGAAVTALDVDEAGAASVASSLRGEGHGARALDVTDAEAVGRAAEEVFGAGRLDSVVYSPGIETTCDVVDTDWEVYHRVLAVNLHGAVRVAQAFGRHMLEAGAGGSFVFLASTAGKRGEAGAAAYCASKFGLLGVVECFAAEAGPHGIRVNALCPGNVDSPMLRAVAAGIAGRAGSSADEVLDAMAAEAAERRLVRAEEVARAAVWLASPAASGVNGESLNVDAGALTG
jgi:NAD(P)-dependent dehydrogenase (short-subunit alcohol dehydrogenase family)